VSGREGHRSRPGGPGGCRVGQGRSPEPAGQVTGAGRTRRATCGGNKGYWDQAETGNPTGFRRLTGSKRRLVIPIGVSPRPTHGCWYTHSMSPGGGRRRHYPQAARSPVGLRWGWGLAATSSNAPVLRCARSEHGREGVGLASSRAITPHAACPTVGAPTHISHGRSLRSQSGRVKLRRPGRRRESGSTASAGLSGPTVSAGQDRGIEM
jgi:hypothetical protein